ncbi:MAG: hypothetical protein AAFN77_20050 [Planctomycetota bacterium]
MWQKIESIEYANVILFFAILAVLIAISFYVVNWLRGMAYDDHEEPETLLTDFQQLKQEGKLSEDEFERVKTKAIDPEKYELPESSPGKPVPASFDKISANAEETPPVLPTNDPPISLAEALARKKAQLESGEVQPGE